MPHCSLICAGIHAHDSQPESRHAYRCDATVTDDMRGGHAVGQLPELLTCETGF